MTTSEVGDRLRGADAGDDVFALRVEQEFAVEHFLAGAGIAREADAGGGVIAHVAEDHGLHVGGGADIVRDLFHLAVVVGLVVPPGAEHGADGESELFARIFRERLFGFLLDELLVIGDDGLEIVGGEIGIELGFRLWLCAHRRCGRTFPCRCRARLRRTSG